LRGLAGETRPPARGSGAPSQMAKENKKPNDPARVTVCGIAASAGGLEVLREFFAAVPPDLGIAYVVVVHLAPEHESDLASLLARRTKMPVQEVRDDQKLELEPDSVYVIGPDRMLQITDTTIGASRFTEPRGHRAPIDVFFRSLGESHGDGSR
jgi:two-component system, chemotaxis family, CheB/CheR fusion protein